MSETPLWAVVCTARFDELEAPIRPLPGEPTHFMPVFETREAAEAFNSKHGGGFDIWRMVGRNRKEAEGK